MLSSFSSPLNSIPDIPGIISVVTAGIISVVIGGHFGGGDHFDGGGHFGGGTGGKNKKKLLNKKTFQINLEKNDNQSGSILFRFS